VAVCGAHHNTHTSLCSPLCRPRRWCAQVMRAYGRFMEDVCSDPWSASRFFT
jgi:hypothetical protein